MIDTSKAILMVKAFYIKQRAGKMTTEQRASLTRYLIDNTTKEQKQAIDNATRLNAHATTTLKTRVQLDRTTFYQRNYVKLFYRGGGWYAFSPSAHKNYNRNDEILIHGFDNLNKALKGLGLFTLGCKGWTGTLEYIGQLPKKFF